MNSVNIKNRKARYNYHVLDKYVSGIVLSGNEIKSIRESKASLNNCYCEFDHNNELYIINMNIDEYSNSNEKDYSPQKKRKLLLNKTELKKLTKESVNPGITIVPLNLFINKKVNNIDKVQIKKFKNSLINPFFKPISEVIKSKIKIIQSIK